MQVQLNINEDDLQAESITISFSDFFRLLNGERDGFLDLRGVAQPLKEDVIRRLACADTWPCFFKRAQASTNGDGVFATDEVEIVQGQPSVRLDIAEGVSLKDVKSFLVAALEWIRNQETITIDKTGLVDYISKNIPF